MPTPQTAEAVTRLIASRARLTEITKKLNETHPGKDLGSETRQRYDALEKEWEAAFEGFKAAVREFTAAIQRAKPSN